MFRFNDMVTAIEKRDVVFLKEYINQCDYVELNAQDEEGNTLLHIATETLYQELSTDSLYRFPINNILLDEIIPLLIENVDVGVRNSVGDLAVYRLIEMNYTPNRGINVQQFSKLLSNKRIRDICLEDDAIRLHDAVKQQKWNSVRELLQKGVDVSVLTKFGNSALTHRCRSRCSIPDDIVRLLFHPGVLNSRINSTSTPLMLAAEHGHSDLILQLVNIGADISIVSDKPERKNFTPLTYALLSRQRLSPEIFKALIHPTIVNYNLADGSTPLHLAIRRQKHEAILPLLDAGADITLKASSGKVPLEELFIYGLKMDVETMKRLLPAGLQIHPKYFLSLLIKWISESHPEKEDVVKILSMMLLQSKLGDIFSENQLVIKDNLTIRLLGFELLPMNSLQIVYAFCLLMRKGLVCRTGPQCTHTIIGLNTPDSALKEAHTIDSLWKEPWSLSEECCSTIKRSIHNPTQDKIAKLPLPSKLSDLVLFSDFTTEFYHIMIDLQEKSPFYPSAQY